MANTGVEVSWTRRGFSLVELLVLVTATFAVLAVVLPVLAGVRRSSGVDVSIGNLATLGVVHAVYAADWNGRQFTAVVDGISTYGNGPGPAFSQYASQCGGGHSCWHPPLILGWGTVNDDPGGTPVFFNYFQQPGQTANNGLVVPITFPGGPGGSIGVSFGTFRIPNNRGLHNYVGGRFYDPAFYAPRDTLAADLVSPFFDWPYEYSDGIPPVPDFGDIPGWSSYVLSPAAMFHPDVMRHPSAGGWQMPWSLAHGFESPSQHAAVYPHLKTQMIEHHWNQNTPKDVCNPNFNVSVFACEPYYFNHALASEPVALFYDGSVRLFSNTEALAADQQVLSDTGFGLWSRDTTFGENGYLIDDGFDGVPLSHHILTTDGIHGRDTLDGFGGALPSALAGSWHGPGAALRAAGTPWPASDPAAAMSPDDGATLFDLTP